MCYNAPSRNRCRLDSEKQKLTLDVVAMQERLAEQSKTMDVLSKKFNKLSGKHVLIQQDLQVSQQSRVKSEQQASCLLDKLEDAEVTLKEALLMSTKLQQVRE